MIGEETFFIWMSIKPDVLKAIIRHVVDYEIEATRRFLEAASGLIDITYVGNDYGSQRGLVISPAMWNEFIRAGAEAVLRRRARLRVHGHVPLLRGDP